MKSDASKQFIRLSWLIFGLALASPTPAATQATPPPRTTPAPADRLFLAHFHLIEIGTLALDEANRPSPIRRQVAVLHSADSDKSPVIGFVHAVITPHGEPNRDVTFGLDVELTNAPGHFHTWMTSVGDWFYRLYVAGVRPRGQWVQLFGPPFPAEAWISTAERLFEAEILPSSGEILALREVRAAFPNGARRQIPAGNYLIQRTSSTAVEFRAELAADMACGEEVPLPAVMPPTLRAAPSEFFNADGSPRFSYVYVKGC